MNQITRIIKEAKTMEDYIKAHKYAFNHREESLQDKKCGCFFCLAIFSPKEISYWIEDTKGTAECPYCGMDSIIGESSGYPITKEFLKVMNVYWF